MNITPLIPPPAHPTRRAMIVRHIRSSLPSLVALVVILLLANFVLPQGLITTGLSIIPVTGYTFVERDPTDAIVKQVVSHDAGAATALRMQINALPVRYGGCGMTLGASSSSASNVYVYTFTLFDWTLETVIGHVTTCGAGTVTIMGGASYPVQGVPGTD